MLVKGGYTNYGEILGILMLDTYFARPVGDLGNAKTFPFPVRYKKVKNASVDKIIKEADKSYLEPFIESAKELEKEGVKAITTSCGFLAMFQKELSDSLDVPIFTSSLMQVPFLYRMFGRKGKVGVLTASKASLTDSHFIGVGIEEIPVVIEGMDDTEEFSEVFLMGKNDLDFTKCEQEMQEKALELVKKDPGINVIVLECTNMPPYKKKIQEVTQKPVFDIITLIKYVYSGLEID